MVDSTVRIGICTGFLPDFPDREIAKIYALQARFDLISPSDKGICEGCNNRFSR